MKIMMKGLCGLLLVVFSGLVFAIDTDNDGYSDADEAVLGSDPLKRFDPPKVVVDSSHILAMDHADTSQRIKLWDKVSGAFIAEVDGTGFIDYVLNDWDILVLKATGVDSVYLGGQLFPVSNGVKLSVGRDISDPKGNYACVLTSVPNVQCSYGKGDPVVTKTGLTNPTAVSVGEGFACAIHNNGKLLCWTYFGSSSVPGTPGLPNNNTKAVAIASGADHLCAIFQQTVTPYNRSIKCYGKYGTNTYKVPTVFANNVTVSALSIDAHGRYTCLIIGSYSATTSLQCFNGDQNTPPTSPVASAVNPISVSVNNASEVCVVQKGIHQAQEALRCSVHDIDSDGDSLPDFQDTDDDNDGVLDANDYYPIIPVTGYPDNDADGWPDLCNQSCTDSGMTADPERLPPSVTIPTLVNPHTPQFFGDSGTCNGNADDSDAFQAALDAGDVMLLAGNCVINKTLTITTSNKHLQCNPNTKLVRPDPRKGYMILVKDPSPDGLGGITGDSIVGCNFVGTNTDAPQYHEDFPPGVIDLTDRHWDIPIMTQNKVDNFFLAGNTFSRFFGQSMFQTYGGVDGGSGDVVIYNTFQSCGYYGPVFVAQTGARMAYNTMIDCAAGVENDDPYQVTGGNILEYNTLTAVYGYGAAYPAGVFLTGGVAGCNNKCINPTLFPDYSSNIVRYNRVSGVSSVDGFNHAAYPSQLIKGFSYVPAGNNAQYTNNECVNGCQVIAP